MHLSKVSIVNYRNFANTKFLFSKGINTIIGENGSGKTNLFRAIRLLLDDSMRRSAMRLAENDFYRGLSNWRGHWIIISLEFDEVSQDESIQALFLHGVGNIGEEIVGKATYNLIFRPKIAIREELSQLALGDSNGLDNILERISIEDYETVITGKSDADFNEPLVYSGIVGDFDSIRFPDEIDQSLIGAKVPQILSMHNEVSFTFVQALRDVVSEFHNNRTNPLLSLLKRKSDEINPEEFSSIVEQVTSLNTAIEELSDVKEVRGDIVSTINDAVGDAYSPNSLSIKSDLPDKAEQLFQSLKLFISESDDGHEGTIQEMSLGGANLIYLTLKLLEFKYQNIQESIANFLFIEEPEAHIHTHIQKSLFDKIKYSNTQVIYSTHSSHISEASNVKNINIIGQRSRGGYQAFQPTTGLSPPQIGGIQRYLDAVRSNLLFAKSVMLVEGDAEEILIPAILKETLGISLDELGISLVNIRSTGFKNVALLFHDIRIRKKCSIITDLDASFFDTTEVAGDTEAVKNAKSKSRGSAAAGIARQRDLELFCNENDWLNTFYAPHTFEVDLIAAGNSKLYVNILHKVYTELRTIETSKQELESADISIFGKRALTMATNTGKGWFAIVLAQALDYKVVIPDYIIEALIFTHGSFSEGIVFKILNYHLEKIYKDKENQQIIVDTTEGQDPQWHEDWNVYLTRINTDADTLKQSIDAYRAGLSDINSIKAEMIRIFPDHAINSILRRM